MRVILSRPSNEYEWRYERDDDTRAMIVFELHTPASRQRLEWRLHSTKEMMRRGNTPTSVQDLGTRRLTGAKE